MSVTKKSHTISTLAGVSLIGVHLVSATAVGFAIGFLLDKWLHTQPFLMVSFFILGIIAGFREIFRQIRKTNAEIHIAEKHR